MNEVSITITGEVNELTRFLKSFNTNNNLMNNIKVETSTASRKPKNNILSKTKHDYTQYTGNPVYKSSILKTQARSLANKYIKQNETVRFLELSNYIKDNSPDSKAPSNYSLKNFLVNKKYLKYRVVYEDNTSEIVWEKA
jgi:hypothetical protein